jgi:Flp pilus assembly protein TadD
MATFLHQEGNIKAATAEYLSIIEREPDNVSVLNKLARSYQEQGSARGLPYAERAYELAPERVESIDTLGWLLLNNGEHPRALLLLQEAALRAPHQAELRYHLAVALAKAGRNVEARKELTWLLENKQNFASADEARELLERLESQ